MKSLKERIIMTDRTKPKSVSKTQRRCRNHFREIQLQAKHVTTEVTHPRTDCTLTVLYREIHEELKINGTNFQCIDSYTKHFDMKHRNDGSKFDTPEHSPELHILRKCETLANRSYFNKIPNPFTRTRGSDSAIETKLLEDMDLL